MKVQAARLDLIIGYGSQKLSTGMWNKQIFQRRKYSQARIRERTWEHIGLKYCGISLKKSPWARYE